MDLMHMLAPVLIEKAESEYDETLTGVALMPVPQFVNGEDEVVWALCSD